MASVATSNISTWGSTVIQATPVTVNVNSTASPALSATGNLYFITGATSAFNITLPALTAGVTYSFTVTAALSNAVTIVAPSACVLGTLVSSDGTAVTGGAITSAKTNVILGTTAAIGDRYDINSDGTHYFVRGVTAVHGSVTLS